MQFSVIPRSYRVPWTAEHLDRHSSEIQRRKNDHNSELWSAQVWKISSSGSTSRDRSRRHEYGGPFLPTFPDLPLPSPLDDSTLPWTTPLSPGSLHSPPDHTTLPWMTPLPWTTPLSAKFIPEMCHFCHFMQCFVVNLCFVMHFYTSVGWPNLDLFWFKN